VTDDNGREIKERKRKRPGTKKAPKTSYSSCGLGKGVVRGAEKALLHARPGSDAVNDNRRGTNFPHKRKRAKHYAGRMRTGGRGKTGKNTGGGEGVLMETKKKGGRR